MTHERLDRARRRYSFTRLCMAVVEALVIAWVLLILAEYFGWHLVQEAGGGMIRAALY